MIAWETLQRLPSRRQKTPQEVPECFGKEFPKKLVEKYNALEGLYEARMP